MAPDTREGPNNPKPHIEQRASNKEQRTKNKKQGQQLKNDNKRKINQMTILQTGIYKLSIPMHPFTIATGTMNYAQNIFIRIHTDAGYYGVGECSAFPMIVGETQATCFEMAKDFATLWKGKNALSIEERMKELDNFTAFNATIKSAFDMALYDLSAKAAGQPLYVYLGGRKKDIETDLTIGIDTPEKMAQKAIQFKKDGVRMIKIKLGKNAKEDVERVRQIRTAVGNDIILRIDANQGWDFDSAAYALREMSPFQVQFCEQPMRHWDDDRLPELRSQVDIRIMADESVFDHHDARKLIAANACDYVNIKFAKSGGILEAMKINAPHSPTLHWHMTTSSSMTWTLVCSDTRQTPSPAEYNTEAISLRPPTVPALAPTSTRHSLNNVRK
jgi:L-alanine-DL-glutamate epimerase-like enolase superfamily enzyme